MKLLMVVELPLYFFIGIFIISAAAAPFGVSTLSFEEGYSPLFGDGNLVRSPDDRSVRLLLDQYSGSGFISSDLYWHGFFSAAIQLPSNYTAGIVVAFYASNGDVFEKTHDELDFEFLGNVKGKPWRMQTNVYGNGSTNRGREERYLLPFDPTKETHRYSILWTDEIIIFYIDETPIREVWRRIGGDYPMKPMSLYATIWDASNWATSGGKYKVDYRYSPFVSKFSDLVLLGCRSDPIQLSENEQCDDAMAELISSGSDTITPEKRQAMLQFRQKYMTYSVCYDTMRYPGGLPDCDIVSSEKMKFKDNGHLRIANTRRRNRRRGRIPVIGGYRRQIEI
ncbi:putative xyloglucan:xyloglucosyl transferase [Dioscorea sansibarensis]